MSALLPKMTALDRRVLAALPERRPGVRLRFVHERAQRDTSGAIVRRWASEQDVREVLRGLEHLGLAACRAGWWARP